MVKTSIVIPTYNACPLLAECVAAIRAFTAEPYELIVVDNGSEDDTLDYCRRERLTFVSLPENRGFPAACNIGMKAADGDAILLLNNDVVATRNWLDNMLDCLYSAEDIGIVGPVSNRVSGRQQLAVSYGNLEEMQRFAEWFNRRNPQAWSPAQRIVGFCMLFKRQLLERIGVLDEGFSPGHYEDDDFCYRARLAGYRLMIAGDAFVHHHGSSSFSLLDSESIYQLVSGNYRKFMEKWGVDPHLFLNA